MTNTPKVDPAEAKDAVTPAVVDKAAPEGPPAAAAEKPATEPTALKK